ncbi:MAG: hypothetical protein HQ492_08280, partial [Woeseiaceae bacterium]|nr:hypothetical protein [Woeseiaceae bacterium]
MNNRIRTALIVTGISCLVAGPTHSARTYSSVYLYTAVISSMVITAFGTRGTGAPTLLLAGALMFFLSDLSVALARLV